MYQPIFQLKNQILNNVQGDKEEIEDVISRPRLMVLSQQQLSMVFFRKAYTIYQPHKPYISYQQYFCNIKPTIYQFFGIKICIS